MTPRTLTVSILAVVMFAGIVASAKNVSVSKSKNKGPIAAKKSANSFRGIADHVLKNGVDQTIDAPLSRNLGFQSDEVPTKALRHKSKTSADKKSHGFYVTFSKDEEGRLIAEEIVLSNALISVGSDGQKNVEGFDARIDLDGRLLAAVSSAGPYGKVIQSPLNPSSSQATKLFKSEASVHLEKMDMASLSK